MGEETSPLKLGTEKRTKEGKIVTPENNIMEYHTTEELDMYPGKPGEWPQYDWNPSKDKVLKGVIRCQNGKVLPLETIEKIRELNSDSIIKAQGVHLGESSPSNPKNIIPVGLTGPVFAGGGNKSYTIDDSTLYAPSNGDSYTYRSNDKYMLKPGARLQIDQLCDSEIPPPLNTPDKDGKGRGGPGYEGVPSS